MKVGIVVIVYNLDCRIFLLQIKNIKKYCQDNYIIEVIDNSNNLELSEAIKYHAKNEGVNYTKTDAGNQDPSTSHAFAANLSYQILKDKYDYFFYLDHDCIPVKQFSVTEILSDKIIAGVLQGQAETKYLWPGCVMWNNKRIDKSLVNFNHNHNLRIDTGGNFYKIINRYGYENCFLFDEIGCKNPDFEDEFYYFYIMIFGRTFIHFLNSANWRKVERNDERLNTLINITATLSDTVQI